MLSVQVKLKAIIKNIATIKRKLKPGTKFCAVVKANAYGFGAEKISRLIEPYVDCFAVANTQEGAALRGYGIQKDILIFGVTQDITTAIQHDLIITIGSLEAATNLVKSNLQPRIHLAVNTDMNRFGISSIYELRSVLQLLAHAKVEGVYTHLAYEADHLSQVDAALHKFKKFVYLCKKYFPNAIVHAGCSGVINYPPAHFDMIRIGKALYGGTVGTETVFTVKSKIVAIKKIKTGETVGYNGEFTATKPTVIGVVQGGYATGMQMNFKGANFVTVGKQFCPIVGRVCMDCFFIDVSQIPNPLGKTVTIISTKPGQTIMDISQKTKVIACNILLGLGDKT